MLTFLQSTGLHQWWRPPSRSRAAPVAPSTAAMRHATAWRQGGVQWTPVVGQYSQTTLITTITRPNICVTDTRLCQEARRSGWRWKRRSRLSAAALSSPSSSSLVRRGCFVMHWQKICKLELEQLHSQAWLSTPYRSCCPGISWQSWFFYCGISPQASQEGPTPTQVHFINFPS